MRFTCPKCGKRYASSAEPAPGKAYRLKCKACGETIVLRAGGVVTTAPTPAPGAIPAVAPQAPARPAVPAPAPRIPTPTPEPTASSAETQPVASRLELPVPPVTPTWEVSPPAPAPAPPEGGGARGLDRILDDGSAPEAASSTEDPFAAAARASLPEGYGASAGGAAPDPLAALARDPAGATPEPDAPRREPAPPAFASIAKPDRPRVNPIVILLAAGVLVLVAVLAFAILRADPDRRAAAPAEKPAAEQSARP